MNADHLLELIETNQAPVVLLYRSTHQDGKDRPHPVWQWYEVGTPGQWHDAADLRNAILSLAENQKHR